METKYSSEIPEKVTRKGTRRTLNYNVRELSDEDIKELWEREPQEGTPYDYFAKEHKYSYNSVTMGSARWSYSDIVEANTLRIQHLVCVYTHTSLTKATHKRQYRHIF